MTQYSTGSNIDSWCIKCKLILAHTIEAIVEEKPKKVKCNTCGGRHVYRSKPPGSAKRRTTAAAKGGLPKRVSDKRASDYETYLQGRDASVARRYTTKAVYKQNDLLQHPKFGLGVTTVIKDGKKIEVLFEDGPRVLVHSR